MYYNTAFVIKATLYLLLKIEVTDIHLVSERDFLISSHLIDSKMDIGLLVNYSEIISNQGSLKVESYYELILN